MKASYAGAYVSVPKQQVVRSHVSFSAPLVNPEWRQVVEEELTRCQCSYRDAASNSRLSHVVDSRHEVYRRLSKAGVNCHKMAAIFGQHHTTILHALGRTAYAKRRASGLK